MTGSNVSPRGQKVSTGSNPKSTHWAKRHPVPATALVILVVVTCGYLLARLCLHLEASASQINLFAASFTASGLVLLFAADMLSRWQPEGSQKDHWAATVGHGLVIFAAALFVGAYFA